MSTEVTGIEPHTSVDVELINGCVEVYSYSPRVCCVAPVQLDIGGIDRLIELLQAAKEQLTLNVNNCT